MGKTISLKGDAAGAFLSAHLGRNVTKMSDEDNQVAQIATLVHMEVKFNKMDRAIALLKAYGEECVAKAQAASIESSTPKT